jgi:hypothetical protein
MAEAVVGLATFTRVAIDRVWPVLDRELTGLIVSIFKSAKRVFDSYQRDIPKGMDGRDRDETNPTLLKGVGGLSRHFVPPMPYEGQDFQEGHLSRFVPLCPACPGLRSKIFLRKKRRLVRVLF